MGTDAKYSLPSFSMTDVCIRPSPHNNPWYGSGNPRSGNAGNSIIGICRNHVYNGEWQWIDEKFLSGQCRFCGDEISLNASMVDLLLKYYSWVEEIASESSSTLSWESLSKFQDRLDHLERQVKTIRLLFRGIKHRLASAILKDL